MKVLLFIAILASNAYFLLYWFRAIIPLLIETLRKRLFCGKKQYSVQPMSKAGFLDSVDLSGTSKATRWDQEVDHSNSSQLGASPPSNTPQPMEAEVTFPEGQAREDAALPAS